MTIAPMSLPCRAKIACNSSILLYVNGSVVPPSPRGTPAGSRPGIRCPPRRSPVLPGEATLAARYQSCQP